MAVTAESVVVELIAKTDGYTTAIRTAGNVSSGAMSQIESSASKAEGAIQRLAVSGQRSSAQVANATRNLGRQISDIGVGLAGGQSPFLIIAQQAPQVADALADTGGKAAQVAAFFAGPWGAALLAAGSALGVLLGEALKTEGGVGDLVSKLEEQARRAALSAEADRIFSNTQAGLAAKVRETTSALAAQNASLRTNAQLRNVQARQQVAAAEAGVAQANVKVEAARRDATRSFQQGGTRGEVSSERAIARQREVSASLAEAQRIAREANANLNVSRVFLASENAAANATASGKIARQYDDRIQAIQREAVVAARAGKQIGVVTQQRIEALEKQKIAAIDAAQASERAAGGSGSGGRGRAGVRVRALASASTDVLTAADLVKNLNRDLAESESRLDRLFVSGKEYTRRQQESFRDTFGREGEDYDNPFGGVADYDREVEQRRDAQQKANDELARRQEDQAYSLASIYEDAFTRGTGSALDNFKQQAIRTIATLLAQATVASFGQGGGGLGSLIGNIGKAAGSLFGGSSGNVPKFASGGSMLVGGRAGVDQNMLSLNGQPIAAVSRGETLSVNPNTRAAGRGGGDRHFHISVDARNSVTPSGFADQISRTVLTQAAQMDVEAGKATLRQAPGYVQSSSRFGAPRTI